MDIIETLTAILGSANVQTGQDVDRFSHDWAGGLTWTPACVVRPGSTAEVSAVLKATYAAGVPVVPVAGNTSVTGGGWAEGAVMVSLERMNKIRAINLAGRTATVEAGVVIANLHTAAAEHGLVFPLTFGAQGTAQIGGALSTNAGGSNVVRFGMARALCFGIEAVLPDGRVMNLMSELHKDNTGYDLRDLFIGAEGTLGIITGAVLKLFAQPPAYVTAMIACDDLDAAFGVLARLQAISGNGVEAFEYMPESFIDRHMARVPGAREPFERRYPVNILAHVAANSARDAEPDATGATPLRARIEDTLASLLDSGVIGDAVIAGSVAQSREMWARREAAAQVLLAVKPYVDSDPAVPTDRIAEFLERAGAAVAGVDRRCDPCWVAHLGDGNLHYVVQIPDAALFDPVNHAIEKVAVSLGGTFTAEHGVGHFMRASLARWKDPVALDVMRTIKAALDPKGLMNPGKVFV